MKTLIFTLVGMFFFICANGQIMKQRIIPISNETKVRNTDKTISDEESVWEKVYQLPSQQMPIGIKVVDKNTIWVSSTAYTWITPPINKHYLYRSTDGGIVWKKIEMQSQLEFSAIDSVNVWASVGKIGIIKTANAGESWDTLLISDRFGPIHFFNLNEGIFIACFNNVNGLDKGDSIVIYRTSNGGLDWSLINPVAYGGTIESECCASNNNDNVSADGDTLYFTTTRNRIIYTTNKGETWDQIDSPFDNQNEILTSVKTKGNLNITVISGGYMNGVSNYIWRDYPIIASTIDGGITWTENTCLNLSNALCSSTVPGADSIIFIGAYKYSFGSGGTMISNNYGASYTLIDSMKNLQAMRFLDANTGFAITWNNNDSRVSDTDYILKWRPGIYKERQFYRENEKLPESCPNQVSIANNKNDEISLFPNPCSGQLNITIPHITNENGEIQFFDYLGRQILTQALSPMQQGETITIDLNNQPAGIYLVRLKVGGDESSGKVLLVK